MMPVHFIKIEPAKIEDVESIIPLAFSALSEFALYLADTEDPTRAQGYLRFAFSHIVPNEVHYSNFFVLKNKEDKIIGSFSVYTGEDAPVLGDGGWTVCKEFLHAPDLQVEESQDYEADPGELYIDTISIDSEYRGMGLVDKIIHYVENLAQQKGLKKISLVAAKHKEKLHDYYKKHGFCATGTRHLGKHDYIHFNKVMTQ
ncbi:MAG: GNAT family N-acetyltransferase [Spirochaetia bacterium]